MFCKSLFSLIIQEHMMKKARCDKDSRNSFHNLSSLYRHFFDKDTCFLGKYCYYQEVFTLLDHLL